MGNVVTRFPNGVTNVDEGKVFSDLPFPDPTKFHTYFDDFDTYTAGQWTVTETQVGATQALASGEDGGVLVLTNTAADNDTVQLQLITESFKFAAGKKLWFKARVVLLEPDDTDISNSDMAIGLVITDTSVIESAPSDGVYFLKADGAATVVLKCGKDSTYTTSGTVATMVDGTYVVLEFFYDGGSYIYYGADGVMLGSIATTNLPNDEELAVTIAVQNGEAEIKNMSIDYVFVAKER